jgi:hypothetical protein
VPAEVLDGRSAEAVARALEQRRAELVAETLARRPRLNEEPGRLIRWPENLGSDRLCFRRQRSACVAGVDCAGGLDQQDRRFLVGMRAVLDAAWNDE